MRNTRTFLDVGKLGQCALLIVLVAFFIMGSSMDGDAQDANARVAEVSTDVIPLKVEDKSDISFRRLTPSDGLSQTRASAIAQDDDGYIWFGTQHGISRYDGNDVTVFKHVRYDRSSLSGIFIYSLFKDRDGTMWAGTDQYLDAFDRSSGAFKHYPIDASNPAIIDISQDKDGLLWLATSKGLFSLNSKTGAIQKFTHNDRDPDSLSSSDIKSANEDRQGNFWVATSKGLERFDRRTGKVLFRIPLRQEVREFGFHEDRHGTFWIYYGAGNGLATYDRKTNQVTRFSYAANTSDSSLGGVYAALEARNGDMWFATMGNGLLRFDREKQTFSRYLNDPTSPQSLAENRVIALFEDREGNIWTGLHATLPNVFPEERPSFTKIWPYARHVDQFGEALVNTIFEDRKGDVWLGAGGALNRITRNTNQLATFHPAGPGVQVEILAISQDQSGTIWIGTLGAGLIGMDPVTAKFKQYRAALDQPDALQSDIVTRIYPKSEDEIWVTTWNGLSRFNSGTERFQTYKNDPTSSAEAYFSISPDPSGSFWLGTTGGLLKFDPTTGSFRAFTPDLNDLTTLSNNTVNSVYVQSSDVVWIGTQNGLSRLDERTGEFFSFFERHGLAGNAVSCLVPGKDDSLWMSTNQGISRMNLATGGFENFSTSDGLPGLDLTGWNACAKGADGRMYFGGFAGATMKSPSESKSDIIEPSVVFTNVNAGDMYSSQLTETSNEMPTEVSVPYYSNHMTISFAALTFRRPENIVYRYLLKGYETEWHQASREQRSVSFAALPIGKFELLVQASTRQGSWSGPVARMEVSVLPPWWQTWWFYLLLLALALAAVLMGFRIRLAQLADRYRIRLDERTAERNRVARELHDTLLQSFQGLIFRLYATRSLMGQRPDDAAKMLDQILLKSDDAMIEGRQAIEMLRDPRSSQRHLIESVRLAGEELRSNATAKPPAFEVISVGREFDIEPKVRDDIYRIVVEALRNAFKHSGASRIECELRYGRTTLEVVVKDDGTGIPLNSNVPKSGRRWGIEGMKERAGRIGGTLDIDNGSSGGTTIKLLVPQKRSLKLFRPVLAAE